MSIESEVPGRTPEPLTPLRPLRLSEQIYERIVALIIGGEFTNNSKLPTENELAERFAVSRTIVREALARLRDDGVVLSRQGAGTFVRRQPDSAVLGYAPVGSIADIQRCFEFRVALEGEAAVFASLRADPVAIEKIERAIGALDEVVRQGILGTDADYNFHFAIAEATQNRFFVSTMAQLKTHIDFGINLTRSLSLLRPAGRVQEVQAEHRTIFEAIRAGDSRSSREAMRGHIQNAQHRMFEGQSPDKDDAVSKQSERK